MRRTLTKHRPRSLTPQQQLAEMRQRFMKTYCEDFRSRLPEWLFERIAAMTDPEQINELLKKEFTRVLDQMEGEYLARETPSK